MLIKNYFSEIEERNPCEDHLSVCEKCHRVKDDSIYGHDRLGLAIRCKACHQMTNLEDSTCTCSNCKIKYEWKSFKKFGRFLFLVPVKR